MIADCFSKVSFIELCLIFYLSVYPMACKNDVIVLMQRKNKLLIDPIFETKRRPALRGLLYAPDDKLRPIVYTLPKLETNDIGTRMLRHAKGKFVDCHLYADKIKTYIKNHTKIRTPCIPLRGILRKTLRFSLTWNPIFALCHHRTVVREEKKPLYTS